jgi:hypothetical protein
MSDENNDEDPIDKSLGLTPQIYSGTIATIVEKAVNDSATEDFTFARANIREIIENGNDAISKLATIADQSQNPRAFEVLAKLMDSMVIANEKLLELQKEIKEIDKANAPNSEQAKSITNNLFVGSTAELQKVLKDMRNDRNPEL